MKHAISAVFALLALSIQPALAENMDKSQLKKAREQLHSQERFTNAKHPSPYTLHEGSGEVKQQEYVIIDLSGSITRSPCPYTCEDRGLSKNNCKAWQSAQDPEECYVQNTKIPSDAFPGLAGKASQGGQQHEAMQERARGQYKGER